jgi:hypothetical protein
MFLLIDTIISQWLKINVDNILYFSKKSTTYRSIGGARWGRSDIPGAMLGHCEILERAGRVAALPAVDW